jgi:hypothetical protein
VESVDALLRWLEATSISVFIQESSWAFPAIETVHVIALALVIGTIAIVDLRLLGLASRQRPVTELCHEILPWTWGAFVCVATAGVLMFVSQPTAYYVNTAFRIKLLLLIFAGANMLVFQLFTYRDVSSWDRDKQIPLAGKIAGAISLTCWVAIVFLGRWIGFTMMPE